VYYRRKFSFEITPTFKRSVEHTLVDEHIDRPQKRLKLQIKTDADLKTEIGQDIVNRNLFEDQYFMFAVNNEQITTVPPLIERIQKNGGIVISTIWKCSSILEEMKSTGTKKRVVLLSFCPIWTKTYFYALASGIPRLFAGYIIDCTDKVGVHIIELTLYRISCYLTVIICWSPTTSNFQIFCYNL
jgi:hypothetical protein